jgi:hypothetical protein
LPHFTRRGNIPAKRAIMKILLLPEAIDSFPERTQMLYAKTDADSVCKRGSPVFEGLPRQAFHSSE